VLQGYIMLLYDRGTYLGTFRSFNFEETDDSPFAFSLNWEFKVEKTILKVPTALVGRNLPTPALLQTNPLGKTEPTPDAIAAKLRESAEKAARETANEKEHQREVSGYIAEGPALKRALETDVIFGSTTPDSFEARQQARNLAKGLPITGGLRPPR